jgi:hypothetical protein
LICLGCGNTRQYVTAIGVELGAPASFLSPVRQHPLEKGRGFQRNAVAGEPADDLHPEREAAAVRKPGTLMQGGPSRSTAG